MIQHQVKCMIDGVTNSMTTGEQQPKIQPDISQEPWPRWRIRLARLSPYALEIEQQLDRLYRLTVALTIVPGVMAAIVLTLFVLFGRADVGLISIALIFGPMIGLAWWDYRRISRQARTYLASKKDD